MTNDTLLGPEGGDGALPMREELDIGDGLLEGFGVGDGGMMDIGEMPQVSDLSLDQPPENEKDKEKEPTPMDEDQPIEQATSKSMAHIQNFTVKGTVNCSLEFVVKN